MAIVHSLPPTTRAVSEMQDDDIAEVVTGINFDISEMIEKGAVIQRYGSNIVTLGKPSKKVPPLLGSSIWDKVIVKVLPKGTLIKL